ncbi:MAG: SDR family NAD(P)-dependent oxidoreductase [Reyranellales bacterium]
MLIRFDGQTVIVAGAARGIGRAIVRAFVADGANVLACDKLVGEIEAGERVKALPVDVTDPKSIAAVVATAGGKVDVLVYVAGGILGQQPKPLEEVQPEEFAGIVDVNLKGCFLFARAVAPGMKTAGGGRIVTISSRAGLATSLTGIQAYAAAKHGQVGLVKQLAQELGPFGITVNSVAPGFMATSPDYERQWNSYSAKVQKNLFDRIAMRRVGKPEDIADAVVFLASEHASWITGQILPVTGSPLA